MRKPVITEAKYKNFMGEVSIISAKFDDTLLNVPICPGNKEYDEIIEQVESGNLTIEPADE